jgi:hypothetical protein
VASQPALSQQIDRPIHSDHRQGLMNLSQFGSAKSVIASEAK